MVPAKKLGVINQGDQFMIQRVHGEYIRPQPAPTMIRPMHPTNKELLKPQIMLPINENIKLLPMISDGSRTSTNRPANSCNHSKMCNPKIPQRNTFFSEY